MPHAPPCIGTEWLGEGCYVLLSSSLRPYHHALVTAAWHASYCSPQSQHRRYERTRATWSSFLRLSSLHPSVLFWRVSWCGMSEHAFSHALMPCFEAGSREQFFTSSYVCITRTSPSSSTQGFNTTNENDAVPWFCRTLLSVCVRRRVPSSELWY